MSITEQDVLEALRGVRYPGFSRDLVACGVVQQVRVEAGRVHLTLDPGPGNANLADALARAAQTGVAQLSGVESVQVELAGSAAGAAALKMTGGRPTVAQAGALDTGLIPEVRHTIAVASGKGGVGKSTVAVNLAVAFARSGAAVGLLDADIYGPSIPLMMGVRESVQLTPERKIVPFERFGVRFMSLGFLVDPDSAVIWRGPMVMKAIDELLRNVLWGALDVLVIDMPPGTGDAQLTVSQKVRLAGAVIVTTPQDVALADAVKGVAMFRKVEVPVLGIVENMSFFQCPHCSGRTEIFSHGGGRREAERLGVPFLGEVPLDTAIRHGGDCGRPVVAELEDSPQAAAFVAIAARVREALEGEPRSRAAVQEAGGTLFDRFRKVWGDLKS